MEPSGPVKACNGIALPLPLHVTACLCPRLDQSSPYTMLYFSNIYFRFILTATLASSKWPVCLRLPHPSSVFTHTLLIRTTCPAYLILLYLITRKICEKSWKLCSLFFSLQCHRVSLMDFVISPTGCGRSVIDFWGRDAHEAQLRCPDEVDGDIYEYEIPGGALNLNSAKLPRPWAPWESPPSRKNSHRRTGNRTSWSEFRNSDHSTTRLVSRNAFYSIHT
jgi:hypothetical protein